VADGDTPSARERQLARELRRLRAAVGLNGREAAERLGWSASKVSRIETSRTGVSTPDLEQLLALYGADDERAAYLRKLAPSARSKGWWDAYADALSSGYATLIRLESGSRALQCYCALIPHALLLAPDYLEHVILSGPDRPLPVEVNRRIQICRRRQEALTRNRGEQPLQLSAVVDEAVLRRQVTNPDGSLDADAKRNQLQWLTEIAAWPNVTIQVLPFAAGLPPVTAGSFSVLESLATEGPDVVYLENKTRVTFIDAEAEVHRYTRAIDLLSEMALPPEDSLALLVERLRGLGSSREQDGHPAGSSEQ
jgi:transcriptional regulator with XRE-family HTH domain